MMMPRDGMNHSEQAQRLARQAQAAAMHTGVPTDVRYFTAKIDENENKLPALQGSPPGCVCVCVDLNESNAIASTVHRQSRANMAESPAHAQRMLGSAALTEEMICLSPEKIQFSLRKFESETQQDTEEADATQLERRVLDNTQYAGSSSASSSQLVPTEPGGGVLEIEASAIQERDGETFNVSMSAEVEELRLRLYERELWKEKLERLLHRKMSDSSKFTLSRALAGLHQATYMLRVMRTRVQRMKSARDLRCCWAVLHEWEYTAKAEKIRRTTEDEVADRTLLTVEQRMVIQERDALRGEIEDELGRHLMTCKEVHRMLETCALRTAYDRFFFGCRLFRVMRDAAEASLAWRAAGVVTKRNRRRAWNEWASGTRHRIMAGELDRNRARVEEVLTVLREQSAVVVLETDLATQAMEATGLRTRIAQLLRVPDRAIGVLRVRHNGRLAEISLQSAQRKPGDEMRSALELGEELVEKWSAGERAEAPAGRGARVMGRMDRGICNLLAGWCVEMSALETGAQNAVGKAEARIRMLESERTAREAEREEERERSAKERERFLAMQNVKDALAGEVEALKLQLASEVEENARKQQRIQIQETELGELTEESRNLRQRLQSSEAKAETAKVEQTRLGEEIKAMLAAEQRRTEKLSHRLAESETKTTRCETAAEQLQGALAILEGGLRGAVEEAWAGELALQELEAARHREAVAGAKVLRLEKELGSALRALWAVRKGVSAVEEEGEGELGLVLTDRGTASSEGESEERRGRARVHVRVLAVREGSAAAQSREISAGDEILGVGGELVSEMGGDKARGLLRGRVGARVLVQGRRARTGEEYAVMLAYMHAQCGGLSPEVISEEVGEAVRGLSKRAREAEDGRRRVEGAWEEERRGVREEMRQLHAMASGPDAFPDASASALRRAGSADACLTDVNANPRLNDAEPLRDTARVHSVHSQGQAARSDGKGAGDQEQGGVVGEVRAWVQQCAAAQSHASQQARCETRSAGMRVAAASQRRQQLRAAFRALRAAASALRRRAERSETAARVVCKRSAGGMLALAWRCWVRAAAMAALQRKVAEMLGCGQTRSRTEQCFRGWLRHRSVGSAQTEGAATQTERTQSGGVTTQTEGPLPEGAATQTERTLSGGVTTQTERTHSEGVATQTNVLAQGVTTQTDGAQAESVSSPGKVGLRSPVKVVSTRKTQTDGAEPGIFKTPTKLGFATPSKKRESGIEDREMEELLGSPWGKGKSLV